MSVLAALEKASIGIQTKPPQNDEPFPHGSFHEAAARELFHEPLDSDDTLTDKLKCYGTHEQLLGALNKNEIAMAVIAIDNTVSGRVPTAIEALRDQKLRIIGKVTISVAQHILRHPDTPIDTIVQVVSQKPALDQASAWLELNEITPLSRSDTVGSAREVALKQGVIDNKPTAAIASILAGSANGLSIGEQVSPRGNATTFWLVEKTDQPTDSPEVSEDQPRHAALYFDVPNVPGKLFEIVGILSDAGYDLVDIDCHLNSHRSVRSFFTEIDLGNHTEVDLSNTLAVIPSEFNVDLRGVYTDSTKQEVKSAAIKHRGKADVSADTLWNGRHGLEHDEEAPVLYIQAKNQPGSLKGMLEILNDFGINIVDMSRPYAPEHENGRGFYFVLPVEANIIAALHQLKLGGYVAEEFVYQSNALAARNESQ